MYMVVISSSLPPAIWIIFNVSAGDAVLATLSGDEQVLVMVVLLIVGGCGGSVPHALLSTEANVLK